MNKQLQRELRSAGAPAGEAAELAELADRLRILDVNPEVRTVGRRWRLVPMTLSALFFLMVGTFGVASAQTSLPGNWLYPVKRLSENTAVAITPSYRATLMMRRAEEVKLLVNKQASSGRVLATLAAYDTQASAYKTKDYAAFAYCKANLEQATSRATPAERQKIQQTLASLSDVD